jgi:thiamine biosynthesis lipoprotein ApbE
MHARRRSSSFVFGYFLLFYGCAHGPNQNSDYNYSHTFAAMGTGWNVKAHFPNKLDRRQHLKLGEELSQIVFDHEMALSDWIEESELRKIERNGLTHWQKASPVLFNMMQLSDQAHRLSEGYFDPSVGAVLWKQASKEVGWELELNNQNKKFRFKKDPIRLTFGGIAKGYSVGTLAQKLLDKGANGFVIDAGGGNYAFWGNGSPDTCNKKLICFLSNSRRKRPDNKGDHIVSTRKNAESRPDNLRLQCQSGATDVLPEAGALNDALSTALILHDFELPSQCKVL